MTFLRQFNNYCFKKAISYCGYLYLKHIIPLNMTIELDYCTEPIKNDMDQTDPTQIRWKIVWFLIKIFEIHGSGSRPDEKWRGSKYFEFVYCDVYAADCDGQETSSQARTQQLLQGGGELSFSEPSQVATQFWNQLFKPSKLKS